MEIYWYVVGIQQAQALQPMPGVMPQWGWWIVGGLFLAFCMTAAYGIWTEWT